MVSHHPAKFGGHVLNLPRVLPRPQDLRAMRLYGKEPLTVKQHLAKFGGHRHYGSGDMTMSDCHVILQNHMIKGSCDFMSKRVVINGAFWDDLDQNFQIFNH